MASRDRSRLLRLGWNAGRYALGPLAGVVFPWVVIHHASKALWGEVVSVMVMVQLAAHVLNWGSKDMLLRSFAREPGNIAQLWWNSVATRLVLALPVTAALVVMSIINMRDPVPALAWMLLLFLTGCFDALVIQHKRFAASFIIDAVGLAVQVFGLLLAPALSAERTIHWVLIGQACRLLMLAVVFRRDLSAHPRFDVRTHIVAAFPFFLIGLSGLLGSRMDLYTMTALVDHDTLGVYQVVAALFVQLQAVAALISTPFTRELYRMRDASVRKAATRLGKAGLLLLPVFALIAWGTFTILFHFDLGPLTYVLGMLIAWPAFAYVPLITWLYRSGHERAVLLANFAAAALGLSLAVILVPRLGINGALLGAACGQWLVLVIVVRTSRRASDAMS